MHQRIRELMIEAGYAAPELASRAHKLAELIIAESEKLNKAQSYELAGVIIDTEAQGFDTVCLDTVTRVEQYLAGKSLTKHFYEHLP